MPRYSQALHNFRDQLSVASQLVKLESRYSVPPAIKDVKASNGLKGGAAVLMVAAFEAFLQSVMEEYIGEISAQSHRIDCTQLPEEIWIHGTFESLTRAMRGSKFNPPPPNKVDRLNSVTRACRSVLSGSLDPEVFSDTGGNPNPKNTRELFKTVGFKDIFSKIKINFDIQWKSPTSATFHEDKLLEIVQRRNRVAHNADMRNITRGELLEAIRFLDALATVLERELGSRVRLLIRECPKRP